MNNYIVAENLKHKRSFLKKLLIIVPLVVIIQAFILMPMYFTVNAYNWWYIILMPATFSLIPAMMHRKEDRKLKYRAVYPLEVNLSKIWLSKIATALTYIVITASIHMIGVFVLQSFIGNMLIPAYRFSTLALASALLVVTNIWQVPLCFFLAKRFGFVASVAGNTILGLLLGILLSDGSNWIICPYSWGIRLMVPIMKILPNGVPVEYGNTMLTNTPIMLPCLLSLILFAILSAITAKWFSKLEVK